MGRADDRWVASGLQTGGVLTAREPQPPPPPGRNQLSRYLGTVGPRGLAETLWHTWYSLRAAGWCIGPWRKLWCSTRMGGSKPLSSQTSGSP